LETILDLKGNLSKILRVDTNILWVVENENGIIYDDECKLTEMTKHKNTIEIVVGNSDRTVEEEEPDVISGRLIKSKKCDMTCTHLTSNAFCIIFHNYDE
jgi:hypothetical protein